MLPEACPERSRRVTPAHKGLAPSRLINYLSFNKLKDAHTGHTQRIKIIE